MNIVEVRQELQSSTEGNVSPENYITTEHQPVKIENNSRVHVVNITTCNKCNSHASEPCGESSVTSLCSQLTNINIEVTNNFGIVIITNNGQFSLDVQPDNTIEEVKSKIQSKEGVTSAEQRLYFNGRHLRDDRTLTSYEVEHGSSIQLVLRLRGGLQIFYRALTFETKVVRVDHFEKTVWELKEKICQQENIPPENQRLIFDCSQLEDHRTLAYYDIHSESSLDVCLRLKGGNKQSLSSDYTLPARKTRRKCIII